MNSKQRYHSAGYGWLGLNKHTAILLVGLLLLGIYCYWAIDQYENQYENLAQKYNNLVIAYNELAKNVFNPDKLTVPP